MKSISLLSAGVLSGMMLFGSSQAVASTEIDVNQLRSTANMLLGTVRGSTEEEINDPQAILGQALFWDMRLSSNGQVACASCHFQENWGSDSRDRSINAKGGRTLQSQTVFHSQETPGLRWLADRASGKDQAMGSITGSMGFDSREDILPVMAQFGYEEMFAAAFPDDPNPMTPENYGQALEVYQTTLRTPAPFDDWLAGNDEAMTADQVKGLQTFINTGCAACHGGNLIGGTMLQKFGIHADYWEHTGSDDINQGLMRATGSQTDEFFFRVPLLRNVAKTYPYFHDGSVADLKTATDVMAKVQLGRTLDDETLDLLVAFMESLTGDIPSNFHAPEGIPFELPEGVSY